MSYFNPIPGYEGSYEISRTGLIKSLKRVLHNGKERKYDIILKNNCRPASHTTYCTVQLYRGGKSKTYLVHRLIALTYIPNPENKPHINHLDNNGANNDVDNIVWCTPSENTLYSIAQGRQDAAIAQRARIRRYVTRKEATRKLASMLGRAYLSNYMQDGTRVVAYICQLCRDIRIERTSEVYERYGPITEPGNCCSKNKI